MASPGLALIGPARVVAVAVAVTAGLRLLRRG
jgi:hypothetical protein